MKKIMSVFLILFVLVSQACVCSRRIEDLFRSPYEEALPESVGDYYVFRDDLGIDWLFCLKAEMDEAHFKAYRQGFSDFLPHTEERVYLDDIIWLDWQFGCESQAWWDPSDDLSSSYVLQAGDAWTLMKYEKGWLYINGHSH